MILTALILLSASPTHDWVMSQSATRYTAGDRTTNAHETLHFAATGHSGFDGRRLVRLIDPGLPTDYVAAFVTVQGYRYATYFPTALARGHRSAFWIIDEASSYLVDAKVAEEDANSGTPVVAADHVSGVAEFGVYLHAYARAYQAHSPARYAADVAFKQFLLDWSTESARVFQANAARFPHSQQWQLFRTWANVDQNGKVP